MTGSVFFVAIVAVGAVVAAATGTIFLLVPSYEPLRQPRVPIAGLTAKQREAPARQSRSRVLEHQRGLRRAGLASSRRRRRPHAGRAPDQALEMASRAVDSRVRE